MEGATACRLDPCFFVDGPVFKSARRDLERHVALFAGLQRNPIECRERLWCKLHSLGLVRRGIEVDLRHFVAGDGGGVLDVNGDVRVGAATAPCNSALAGDIRFDASTRTFLGCNGTGWVAFAAAAPAK